MHEQLKPTHLLSIEDVGPCEVFQVLVVSEDLDWQFCLLKPMSPVLQTLNDC
jgi:hypothetical protein